MAYSLTTAANAKALLAAIVTFATAQGWTVNYDNSGGAGSFGGQIALSSGNCKIAIGEANNYENPIAVVNNFNGATFNDARLYYALAETIKTADADKHYWGHTGSLIEASNDFTRRGIINDVAGPIPEVHFFGNADYIICAMRTAPARWGMFAFGNLDKKGLTTPNVGFALSQYWTFWDGLGDNGLFSRRNARLYSPSRFWPSDVEGGNFHLFIPTGVTETDYGFAAKPGHTLKKLALVQADEYPGVGDVATFGGASYPLDFAAGWINNMATTGGVPLHACPIFYTPLEYLNNSTLITYLGEVPSIRLCNLNGMANGDIVSYGPDNYMVVPWGQRGTILDGGGQGGVYNGEPNTFNMGFAIRKDA